MHTTASTEKTDWDGGLSGTLEETKMEDII